MLKKKYFWIEFVMVNIMVEFQCCNKLKAVAGGLTRPIYNVCSKVLHIKGSEKTPVSQN